MKKTNKEYSLLMYTEEGLFRIKRFDNEGDLGAFVDDFYKKYPDYMNENSDNWIDYAVTGVNGTVYFFTDGVEVE